MSGDAVEPATVLAQYEALRGTALATGPGAAPGLGMTLVLTRGLPAWLAALTALGPPPTASPMRAPAGPPGAAVPPGVRAALTALVADMVLACRTEGSP